MIFPVSTLTLLSKVVREDSLGNLEMLLMCFYLPSEYQPEHSHPHKVSWKSGGLFGNSFRHPKTSLPFKI